MSYFIIIRGALGCGKTTISKKLANILKAEHISIDEVLDKAGLDVVDKKEGCIPAKNFIKSDNTLLPKISKKLAQGKIVILDGCFYHKEQIEHLIKKIKYPHYVFTLKTSVNMCIKRDKERKKSHGEDAAKAIHKLVSRFDFGTVIDISKSLDGSIKKILSYLP